MQMNALAEHPKVVANHQVLREDVQRDAPRGILHDDVGRCDDDFVPKNVKDAAERERREELSVDSYPSAS